jgi:hypothetical protein
MAVGGLRCSLQSKVFSFPSAVRHAIAHSNHSEHRITKDQEVISIIQQYGCYIKGIYTELKGNRALPPEHMFSGFLFQIRWAVKKFPEWCYCTVMVGHTATSELYWPSGRRLSAKLVITLPVESQHDESLRPYFRFSRPATACYWDIFTFFYLLSQ